jgi:protoheme IX farnesyltransferase
MLACAADYCELIKARVTALIVVTAWCGFYFGALKSRMPLVSWELFQALLGIGLVSGGTAALNEVMERDLDRLMLRTARRPLPLGRLRVQTASAVALLMTFGGSLYLALSTNILTGALALATAVFYLALYTPLKKVSWVCTLVGAFPGAMPGLLGWTAARGRLELEALVLFAIVFLWQFPHFYSIAWLYREDYARAGIRMLPVVEQDGRSTARQIIISSLLLIPVSLLPRWLGMTGDFYVLAAFLLGAALLAAGMPLAWQHTAEKCSLRSARRLLQATVFYLPLLLGLMMANAAS